MRCKQDLVTNEITKRKDCLNLHGGMQELGVNYFATYSPVVTWFAIRLLLVLMAIIYSCHMRQIDFVVAYPQAPIKCYMCIWLSRGIVTRHGDAKDYVLKLLNDLYGQKQASRVWNHYLVQHLLKIGFTVQDWRMCLLPQQSDFHCIRRWWHLCSHHGLRYWWCHQGTCIHWSGYWGPGITSWLHWCQHQQTQQTHIWVDTACIIKSNSCRCGHWAKDFFKACAPLPSRMLHPFLDLLAFHGHFSYRSVVGKLNYIAQCTHPELMYSAHSCARFSSNPCNEHGEVIDYIAKYLKNHVDDGIQLTPIRNQGFLVYCDADFAGNWNRQYAMTDPAAAKSRSDWIISYANCPIIWASKLQTQVAFRTTEAEYIALSQ